MSRYIQICEDWKTMSADRLMRQREYETANIKAELDPLGQTSQRKEHIMAQEKEPNLFQQVCAPDNLVIIYCNSANVQRKRQKNMLMKSKFLGKLCHLKHQGKKHHMMQKVESWIDENLDELYERRINNNDNPALQKTKSKAEVMRTIKTRSMQLQKVPSMTNQESELMM